MLIQPLLLDQCLFSSIKKGSLVHNSTLKLNDSRSRTRPVIVLVLMNNLSLLHPDGSRSSRTSGRVSEGEGGWSGRMKDSESVEIRMCRTPRQEARESGALTSIFMRVCAHDSHSWDTLKCAHAYVVQIALEVVYFNENMFSEHVACWEGCTSAHAHTRARTHQGRR